MFDGLYINISVKFDCLRKVPDNRSAEDALKKIAVDSQAMADDRIQSAIGALEPTLTAILSILTGLILISVMLPLLGVMANIG